MGFTLLNILKAYSSIQTNQMCLKINKDGQTPKEKGIVTNKLVDWGLEEKHIHRMQRFIEILGIFIECQDSQKAKIHRNTGVTGNHRYEE